MRLLVNWRKKFIKWHDMDLKKLENQYAELLADPLFDKLELKANSPNIFKILGLGHYEIRHSNFLGWLFDPNENHGINELFLNRFLQDILLADQNSNISILELGSLDYSKIEIRREWQNIDILLITEKFVICIENKIWSGEHDDQLKKYHGIVEREFTQEKIYVYLSPNGAMPTMKEYLAYSYGNILGHIEEILASRSELLSTRIKIYIEDYINNLKQRIMGTDDTSVWANKLYRNHKDLFETVFQNMPNVYDDFSEIMSNKIELKSEWKLGSNDKKHIRFYTERMDDLILRYEINNGWANNEAFLFQYNFDQKGNLAFSTVISPTDESQEYRNKVSQIIGELPGAKNNEQATWKTQFFESINLEQEYYSKHWKEEVEGKIDDFIKENERIVRMVENAFIENKEELSKLMKEHKPK